MRALYIVVIIIIARQSHTYTEENNPHNHVGVIYVNSLKRRI